ncbi:hypothetical protein BLEM_2072 [Bifidobacterium lemurum]|uniref:Uncharacterized protein n=1 Tax=Bifidobacterium lemurum TaxID=1603886 RepID=A0A261FL72_9BIFI|nr:hypothetical protein [Bifidobacterium lemurum]OZG59897.1 hypothetical protein BLEM_2072 [Bifidobacterium lemurum]QOL33923.1 hypothetical protein BL8807_09185 [Bifidobacterium lemurum]
MDVFKTIVGDSRFIDITDDNFTRETGKRRPYYNTDGDRLRCFAVCPACDNPIQIIGLYKAEEEASRSPYGRHTPRSVPLLAEYDQDAYLGCPFSDPGHRRTANGRRSPKNRTGIAIRNLMRDQFDRIVYIWSKQTGIRLSHAFAEKLLRQWRDDEGWRFHIANYQNLPFALLYAQPALPLYGRLVSSSSPLHTALVRRPEIRMVPSVNGKYSQVKSSDGGYVDPSFFVSEHRQEVVDERLEESFLLTVTLSDETVYRERIMVDHSFLTNLMKSETGHRDRDFLDIAARVLR